MLFGHLFFFSKSPFSKNSFRNAIRVANSLDQDQAQHLVGPDLGPNCLQKLSAEDTCRQGVNIYGYIPGATNGVKNIIELFGYCKGGT